MDSARLAGSDGIFSRASARAVGVTDAVLRSWVADGKAVRLTRGWYAAPMPDDPWAGHRLRALAVAREYPDRIALSHYSAVIWYGLPTDGADPRVVHGMRRRGKGWTSPGLVLHDPAPPARRAAVDRATCATRLWPAHQIRLAPAAPLGGLPGFDHPALVVVPAMAVVQTGLVCGPLAALMAADAALRRRMVTVESLEAEVGRYRGVPGIAEVRSALCHTDPTSESPAETKLRWILVLLGWEYRTQVTVEVDGRRYRVDAELTAAPVVLEVDGAIKYAGTVEEGRRAVFLEKQREDRIRRTGREVVRFTVAELTPEIVDARIRAAVALSRSRRRLTG